MTIALPLFEPLAPPVAPEPELVRVPEHDDLARLRASLPSSISSRLSSGTELIRALAKERRHDPILTMIPAIDTLLCGGLERGRLTEITARRSAGRFSTVLATIASVTHCGEAAALIDLGDHFDPRTAENAGADLTRILWVRALRMRDAVKSAELVITTGFQLVIVDLGLSPIPGPRVAETAWIRLARAAEAHGTALLVSSPWSVAGTASDAVLNSAVAHPLWQGGGKTPSLLNGIRTQLRVEKLRHQKPGQTASAIWTMQGVIRGVDVSRFRGSGVTPDPEPRLVALGRPSSISR